MVCALMKPISHPCRPKVHCKKFQVGMKNSPLNKNWLPKMQFLEKTHNFKSNSSSWTSRQVYLNKPFISPNNLWIWLKRATRRFAWHSILAVRRNKVCLVGNCHILWTRLKRNLLWIKKLEDYRLPWVKKRWPYLDKVLRLRVNKK